jgi:hypothetical protein
LELREGWESLLEGNKTFFKKGMMWNYLYRLLFSLSY